MPSDLHSDVSLGRRRRSPLSTVAAARARRLLAVAGLASLLALVAVRAVGLDHAALATPLLAALGDPPVLLVDRPVADLRLQVQVAALAGAVAAAAATLWYGRSHDRVDLRAGRRPLTVAPMAGAAGTAVGYGVLAPRTAAVLASLDGPVAAVSAADPYWLGEFALGVTAATGLGAVLPFALVGAARAGLVPRFTATRQRGLCVLGLVAFAATYSPTDLPSFALVALPPAVGLAVGLAWLEFRG